VICSDDFSQNPLNARNIARWILFFPGFFGGDANYSEKEFIFTYLKEYVLNTIYENCLEIKLSGVMDDKFYDLRLPRNRNGILIKKGSENLAERKSLFFDPFIGDLEEFDSVDEVLKETSTPEEFNVRLNQYKYFVSFDNYSHHNILAALAGCVSVVIPNTQGSTTTFPVGGTTFKDFVFYGFDQVKGISPNIEKLREIRRNNELQNRKLAIELLASIRNYFPHSIKSPTLLDKLSSNVTWIFWIFAQIPRKLLKLKANSRNSV
jgi:hypothetical protein